MCGAWCKVVPKTCRKMHGSIFGGYRNNLYLAVSYQKTLPGFYLPSVYSPRNKQLLWHCRCFFHRLSKNVRKRTTAVLFCCMFSVCIRVFVYLYVRTYTYVRTYGRFCFVFVLTLVRVDLNEECCSVFFWYFPEISVSSHRKKPRSTEISGKYRKKTKKQPSLGSTLL